jgi:hypothetical protein
MPPTNLTNAGLSLFVNTQLLRELPVEVVEVPIEKLLWHFDMPVWDKEGTDDWNLTPWQVICDEAGSKPHRERIDQADLVFPILVTTFHDRLVIIDGVHRLVKAYEAGNKTIQAKVIPLELFKRKEFET